MAVEGEHNPNMPSPTTGVLVLEYVEIPQYGEKLPQIREGYAGPILDRILALQEQGVDFSRWTKVAEFKRPAAESAGKEDTSTFNLGLIAAVLISAAEMGLSMDISLSYYDGRNVHTTTVAAPQKRSDAPTPDEVGTIIGQQSNSNLLIYQEVDSQEDSPATDTRNYTIMFEAGSQTNVHESQL